MLWRTIEEMCEHNSLPGPHPNVWVTKSMTDDSRLLIGPYNELTRLATRLRDGGDLEIDELRQLLKKSRIRLGLRDSDIPPVDLERQERYGETVLGQNYGTDFSSCRVEGLSTVVRPDREIPINRLSDRKRNVASFWKTQTPQAHHIVEYNHLRDLGVSREQGDTEMDYLQLPAVLLAAEFHQRYISSYLKRTHGWTRDKLRNEIASAYRDVYQQKGALFDPLLTISGVILRAAGIKNA
jgi:hypothetical protein